MQFVVIPATGLSTHNAYSLASNVRVLSRSQLMRAVRREMEERVAQYPALAQDRERHENLISGPALRQLCLSQLTPAEQQLAMQHQMDEERLHFVCVQHYSPYGLSGKPVSCKVLSAGDVTTHYFDLRELLQPNELYVLTAWENLDPFAQAHSATLMGLDGTNEMDEEEDDEGKPEIVEVQQEQLVSPPSIDASGDRVGGDDQEAGGLLLGSDKAAGPTSPPAPLLSTSAGLTEGVTLTSTSGEGGAGREELAEPSSAGTLSAVTTPSSLAPHPSAAASSSLPSGGAGFRRGREDGFTPTALGGTAAGGFPTKRLHREQVLDSVSTTVRHNDIEAVNELMEAGLPARIQHVILPYACRRCYHLPQFTLTMSCCGAVLCSRCVPSPPTVTDISREERLCPVCKEEPLEPPQSHPSRDEQVHRLVKELKVLYLPQLRMMGGVARGVKSGGPSGGGGDVLDVTNPPSRPSPFSIGVNNGPVLH